MEADGGIDICAVIRAETILTVFFPRITIETTEGTAGAGSKGLIMEDASLGGFSKLKMYF